MLSLLFAQLFLFVLHKSCYLCNEITNFSILKHNIWWNLLKQWLNNVHVRLLFCALRPCLRCTPLLALPCLGCTPLFVLCAPVCVVRPCLCSLVLGCMPLFSLHAPECVARPCLRWIACPPSLAIAWEVIFYFLSFFFKFLLKICLKATPSV